MTARDKSVEVQAPNPTVREAAFSYAAWGRPLASLVFFLIVMVVLFHQSFMSMVDIWQRSDTFAHGFFIPVISFWLIWRERKTLLSLSPQVDLRWLAALIGSCGVWLLGVLANALVIEQLGVVSILIFGIVVILGSWVGRHITFPLLFLLLMVPMGDDLIEPMMELTATSTVWLIRLIGIPVFREGLYFSLPSGNWSVVEACSGVRYLIASFALGTLYAYLTYRSLYKRTLFVIFSLIIPVIANSLRAFMIVMIGHYSDMTYAVGVDHLIYGWAFFGLVIFIMFWVGSFFADEMAADSQIDEAQSKCSHSAANHPVTVIALSLVLLIMLITVKAIPDWLLPRGVNSSVVQIEYIGMESLPMISKSADFDWTPTPVGPDFSNQSNFLFGQTPIVLHQYHYLKRRDGGELVNSLDRWQGDSESRWRLVEKGHKGLIIAGENRSIEYAILSNGKKSQLIYRWYRIDEYLGSDPYMTKIRQILAILDPRVEVFGRYYLSAPLDDAGSDVHSVLGKFVAQLPTQDAVLKREGQ